MNDEELEPQQREQSPGRRVALELSPTGWHPPELPALARRFGGSVDASTPTIVRWPHVETVEPAIRLAATIHTEASTRGEHAAIGIFALDRSDAAQERALVRAVSRLAPPGQTLLSAHAPVLPASVIGEVFGSLHPDPLDDPLTVMRITALAPDPTPHRIRTVGRNAERDAFGDQCAEVIAQGTGAVIQLVGPAGIGKSHLLAEFRRIARDHGYGSSQAFESAHGQGHARSMRAMLVRSLVEGIGATGLEDEVAFAAHWELSASDTAMYLPLVRDLMELPTRADDRRLFDAMSPDARARGHATALAALLRARARDAPLLVTVEDTHWSTAPSRRGLDVVAGQAALHPIILVTTSRPADDHHGEVWSPGEGAPAPRRVDLAPLSPDDARALAASIVSVRRAPWMLSSERYVRDEVMSRCIQRSRGHPLLLEQLLLDVQADAMPSAEVSVPALVTARLSNLGPTTRRALQTAAALGERFDAATVDAVLEGARWDPSAAAAAGLLVARDEGWCFPHALVRDAVYAALDEPQRRAIHRRLADVVRSAAPRAEHLERAADPAAAAAHLEAARHADRDARYAAACDHVERGLACARHDGDRYPLHALAGSMHVSRGRADDAMRSFEAALAVANGPRSRCRGLVGVVSVLRLQSNLDDLEAPLAEAEALAASLDDDELIGLTSYYRGCLLFARGQVEPCLAMHQRAVRHTRAAGLPRAEVMALSGLSDGYYAQSRIRTALDALDRCLTLARSHGFGRIEVANLHMLGGMRALENQLDAGVQACEDAVRMATQVGNHRAEMFALLNLGICLAPRGDTERALGHMDQSRRLARSLEATVVVGMIDACAARVLAYHGDPQRARERARQGLEVARAGTMRLTGGLALGALARSAASDEEREDALREGERLLAEPCVSHNYFAFYEDAIEACLDQRQWDRAERYADALDAVDEREPIGRCRLVSARARALIGWGRAPDDAARAALRASAHEVEAVGFRPLLPRLYEALGRA